MLHDTSMGEECVSCYMEDCVTEYVILFPTTRRQLCSTTVLNWTLASSPLEYIACSIRFTNCSLIQNTSDGHL